MAITKSFLGVEGMFSVVEKVKTVESLFPEKSAELRKKIHFLPKEIIDEMSSFTERNALFDFASSVGEKKAQKKCCEQCLKAHVLEKCNKLEMGDKIFEIVEEIFACEKGHCGYYVDGEELKIIS